MSAFFARLEIMDIIASMLKSVIFGLIIALISSYQGLMVSIASTEVPQRTIKTVVYSLGWIIVFDIIIALGTYIF
jgi:phospholipid/cholesterol/gamma-HCH transport system permease protein